MSLMKIIFKFFDFEWKLKVKCQKTSNRFLKSFYIRLYDLHQFINGSSIGWSSTIKTKPFYPHGTHGIYISGGAKIGKNVTILQNVTIGSNMLIDSKGFGYPVVGDNCFIGAGAAIIGNIKIGNNVRIGANTCVYDDVPDNALVISNEQTNIVKDQPLNNKLYAYHSKWGYFENGIWVEEKSQTVVKKIKNYNQKK